EHALVHAGGGGAQPREVGAGDDPRRRVLAPARRGDQPGARSEPARDLTLGVERLDRPAVGRDAREDPARPRCALERPRRAVAADRRLAAYMHAWVLEAPRGAGPRVAAEEAAVRELFALGVADLPEALVALQSRRDALAVAAVDERLGERADDRRDVG